MPPSSLSTWFKSLLRLNDVKLLLTNTSLRSLTYATFGVGPEISDKLSLIYTASTKVSSIAARAVLDVVKAQDGASTTSIMAHCTADEMSRCTKFAVELVTSDVPCARNVAKNTTHPTKIGLRVIDLKRKASSISRWAQENEADCRMFVDRINRAEGKYARTSPHHRASVAAMMIAYSEIARTVADIVETRVAIAITAPALKSVPSVEELVLAIDAAATQAAFDVAQAAKLMDRGRPPPYEEPRLR